MRLYDDEPYDHGFDLPDTRHEFITKEGGHVSISIHRHWYEDENDNTRFKVSFSIVHKPEIGRAEVTELPPGVDEGKAIDIAHVMYGEDREASDSIREMRAMEDAERRMGA